MSSRTPMRLPPLRTLRVREPNRQETNPCVPVMATVLACWASTGYNTAGCAAVEQQLRLCMDGPKAAPRPPNNINFHLARMAKRVSQVPKHKGKKD